MNGYSQFILKTIDEEHRIITGIATTPSVDAHGDVIEVDGIEFELPIPLLKGHNHDLPIGEVTHAVKGKNGIEITAKIAKDSGLDYVEKTWRQVKSKLMRGLSVGMLSDMSKSVKSGTGLVHKATKWIELSVVTIPANRDASILTVKEFDGVDTAEADAPAIRENKPTNPVVHSRIKGKAMPTFAEQRTTFESKLTANTARMQEIMTKSAAEGVTLDAAESEDYDNLTAENASILKHIDRLKTAESQVKDTAKPVPEIKDITVTDKSRVKVEPRLEKGIAFVRLAKLMVASKGDMMTAREMAAEQYKDQPELVNIVKAAAVSGGFAGLIEKAATNPANTTDTNWASPLVQYNNASSEFIDLLRPQTIIGRIPGVQIVPFNLRIPMLNAGSQPAWVGQGLPKPHSQGALGSMTMDFNKIAVIITMTEELARFSTPSAETLMRDMMIADITQYQDQQFIDPSVSAVGTVRPASITNGVTPHASSGSSFAQITTDVNALFGSFVNANANVSNLVWVMHPRTALFLSTLRTAQDVNAYPGISLTGGTFQGLPVVVSASVPVASSGSTIIVLMNASQILIADDGQVAVDVSREASVQLNDAPSSGAQSLVSLWQNNLIGLRAERYITWKRARASAVAYISGVTY